MIYFGDVLLNIQKRILDGALTIGLSMPAVYGLHGLLVTPTVTNTRVPLEVPFYNPADPAGTPSMRRVGDLNVKIYRTPLEGIVGFETGILPVKHVNENYRENIRR